MYDLSMPNEKPGTCCKCKGTGIYRWGPVVNGTCQKEGTCFSCQGTGQQDKVQIRRNKGYNHFKVRLLLAS